MKWIFASLPVFLLLACSPKTVTPYTYTLRSEAVKFQIIDISDLLTESNVEGAVLIYDEKNNLYYSNDYGIAKEKFSPASTFKIANTMIGLEAGILFEDYYFPWDGKERRLQAWNNDLVLRDAFQFSCVPCYQELAREIGLDRMKAGLEKLAYPGMDVTAENLDNFWLTGKSEISPLEQIDFLKRINAKVIELQPKNAEILLKTMFVEEARAGRMYAKTGAVSENDQMTGGWYVGFIQKDANRIYFATYLKPNEGKEEMAFMRDRITITRETLRYLHYWE